MSNKEVLVASAVTFLCGTSLGAFAGQLLAGPVTVTTQEDTAGLGREVGRLAEALGSLEGALERVATLRPAPAAPATMVREPVTLAEPRLEMPELASSLASLADALRRPPAVANAAGVPRLEAPAWVDRRAAFGFAERMKRAMYSDEEEAWDAELLAVTQQHMFWSHQDVLGTYGKPDEMEADGTSTYWTYYLWTSDVELHTFHFEFHAGQVISLGYDHDGED